jgi:5-methylcytosine-specific restriction enzyme A
MTRTAGLEYWKQKVRTRAEKSFGKGKLADHAAGILDRLAVAPGGVVEGKDLHEIADQFDIALKFVMRALAATMGVVRLEAGTEGPIRVVLQCDKLSNHKASAGIPRRPPSPALRAHLLAADRQTCSHCEKKPLRPTVDHIIPLSLLGADEPGNWVTLCEPCNRKKWQHLEDGFLRLYRGQRIVGPIGTRFKDGHLWPRINGTARYESREDWNRAR